eukprot:scaffold55112_cov54-Phaeocystis_antarctica.AAC.1
MHFGPPMLIPAPFFRAWYRLALTAPAATAPVTHRRRRPRRPRHPRRPRRPRRRPRPLRRPRRRRLPRGLWLWVWVTAGMPAAAICGALLGAASTQSKTAGSSARRPPTARASPTPRPPLTQMTLMGAYQPAVAVACFTRGRSSPHSRPGLWAS